jgi:prenyltransferase beta subunit
VKRLCLPILCGLVWAMPLLAQTAEEKRASIAYVKALQNKDGGFRASATVPASSLRATSAAVRALKYLGGDIPDRAACAGYVRACLDKESGGFADVPGGKPDVFTTAVGIMAAELVNIARADYAAKAVRFMANGTKTFEDIRISVAGLERIDQKPAEAASWLQQVVRMRNPDGTYGEGLGAARATGSAVVAYLRLGGKLENPAPIVNVLNAGQRGDGGFAKEDGKVSDLETSYRVMRAYYMLKQKPAKAAALKTFVGQCRNADGGYGVSPGQPSSIGSTYFAAIILHWLAET